MAVELQIVAQALQASLDPRQNKQAELSLRREEGKLGFSIALLQIIASESYPINTRLASALFFKNFLKRQWTDGDGNHRLPRNEVQTIKHEIVGLMTSVPPQIQSQLGDAVGIIAESDFWQGWDTLFDDLVSRLTPDNSQVNNGVLQVAHSILKRWRPLFRTDELFTEINHVQGKFGRPFLLLLQNTTSLIENNRHNKARLKELFGTMNLMMKLIYDLSCQDIPQIFDDNLNAIVALLQKFLTFDEEILRTDSDDEPGPQEYVRAGALEILSMYTQKYDEDFGKYVGTFVGSTWTLLTSLGLETKYDILVSKALHFLAVVARSKDHAQPFNSDGAIKQVLQGVVVPNLTLRESDVELFEDEPIEFIRRDLEGSDSESRRRAATDFLRSLDSQFTEIVTRNTLAVTEHFLSEYNADPSGKWKSKDTAVYLFSAVAAQGEVTAREGVMTVNQALDVLQFFEKNVSSDLVSQANRHPLLQVDALKYLYTFRSQINSQQWSQAFPMLVQHLASTNYVVYTYAAIAVERVLALTDPNGQPVVDRKVVEPHAKELLEHLFALVEKDRGADKTIAATKVQENEFLMRCIMRVLTVVKDGTQPLLQTLLRHFIDITTIISLNPSNPRFCYYHFEAIGASIRFNASTDAATIEGTIFQPFLHILTNDLQDFMPYVFQIFAALLESEPSQPLPSLYKPLLPIVVKADLWYMKGNVPALVRLLAIMVQRGSAEFLRENQIEPILGIFQQLLATRANDLYALELLENVLLYFPQSALTNYYTAIFQLVMSRLENAKTEAFKLRFVRFYHFISARVDDGLGADFFEKIAEAIQAKSFTGIYLSIIIPLTPKLARPTDRKLAVISLTRTLTDSWAFAEQYKKGWAITCDRLLGLLINPPVPSRETDVIAENDVDDMTFGIGFTPLLTLRRPPDDQWPEITDVKTWVARTLREADAKKNGRIGQFVRERLSPASQKALIEYMQG